MEKNVKGSTTEPQSVTQLFVIMQSRIHEQDKKISHLLEVLHHQNQSLKSCKAIDNGHMENIVAAEICIKAILADSLKPTKEADKEAA